VGVGTGDIEEIWKKYTDLLAKIPFPGRKSPGLLALLLKKSAL
jgi:hypothetical protein